MTLVNFFYLPYSLTYLLTYLICHNNLYVEFRPAATSSERFFPTLTELLVLLNIILQSFIAFGRILRSGIAAYTRSLIGLSKADFKSTGRWWVSTCFSFCSESLNCVNFHLNSRSLFLILHIPTSFWSVFLHLNSPSLFTYLLLTVLDNGYRPALARHEIVLTSRRYTLAATR